MISSTIGLTLAANRLAFAFKTARQGLRQFGPITVLTALDLGEFIDQRPLAAVQVVHDGFAVELGGVRTALAVPMLKDDELVCLARLDEH